MREKQKIEIKHQSGLQVVVTASDLQTGSPELENIHMFKGVLKRTPGVVSLGFNPVGEVVLAIGGFFIDEVYQYTIIVTPTNIYKRVGVAWTSLGSYSATATTFVQIIPYLSTVIIFGAGQSPVSWDGTTLAVLTGLATYKAGSGQVYYSHIFMADVEVGSSRSRTRLQWSNIADPNDWVGGTAGFVDLLDTPGAITVTKPLLDRLIIYKTDSIWEAVYVGDPKIFQVYPKTLGVGCRAAGSVVQTESVHYFLGNDNVYSTTGTDFQTIGDAIKDLLYGPDAIMNLAAIEACTAAYIVDVNEYWLAIPTGSNTYCDKLLMYQADTQSWWLKTLAGTVCISPVLEVASVLWSDMVGDWTTGTISWNDWSLAGTSNRVYLGAGTDLITIDYTSTQDSGGYASAFWQSKDLDATWVSRWFSLTAEVYGPEGAEAWYSLDEGQSWTSIGVQPGGDGDYQRAKWDFNVTTQGIRFKLVLQPADVRVRKIIAYVQPRAGER